MPSQPATRPSAARSGWAVAIQSAVIVTAVFVVGLVTIQGSQAAFSATTANGPQDFAAGTVVLADDDENAIMFDMAGMVPGSTATKCINVTYTGTSTADVRLHGVVGGTGLATYLTTAIDIGLGAAGGATFDCTGFLSTSSLHTTTLADFATNHTDHASGLAGFDGATNPTTRSYQIVVTLKDDNQAQGLTANATFTWEAQNA